MKISKPTLGAAATALVLCCGWGTAIVAPAHADQAAATARTPRAADICTTAAVSGHGVRGQLSRAEAHSRLSDQSAQRREAHGVTGPALAGTDSATETADGHRIKADIHPAQGTSFKELDGADGACATQSVSTQLAVQEDSTTIYTPTLYPPGGSCVELVTVYTRSGPSVSAWDWCDSVSFEASVPIDSAFLGTYTDGSSNAYTGRVIRTDAGSNTWEAALYNHTTGAWDTIYSQSGQNQSGRADGWDIYELYSQVGDDGKADSCVAMAGQTFESSDISVRVNGGWSAATDANADTHYDQPDSAFACPERTYEMVSPLNHWKAVG